MNNDTDSNVSADTSEDDEYHFLSGGPHNRPRIDVDHKRRLFVEEYMRQGMRADLAGIAVGYSEQFGKHLRKIPAVEDEIKRRAQAVVEASKITTDEWAENLKAVAYFDVRELFDADGVIIPSHKLPRHVAKAIASVQYTEKVDRAGNVVARVSTVTFADKNTALITMAKHLGLFERDNSQRGPDLQLVVNLVE